MILEGGNKHGGCKRAIEGKRRIPVSQGGEILCGGQAWRRATRNSSCSCRDNVELEGRLFADKKSA